MRVYVWWTLEKKENIFLLLNLNLQMSETPFWAIKLLIIGSFFLMLHLKGCFSHSQKAKSPALTNDG